MRLVFAGGHLTPALALLQVCRQHGDEVLVIGARAKNTESLEMTEINRLGFDYKTIPVYKFDRFHKLSLISNLPKGISSFLVTLTLLKQFKPQAVVAFGGYVSLPLAFAAACLRLPVILHEQTMHPGLASRLVSLLALKIFTSFPESGRYLPRRSELVGNLLRVEMFEDQPKPSWYMSEWQARPIIYITGGNQGSKIINQTVISLYETLVSQYLLIHQYGGNLNHEFESAISAAINHLPESKRKYIIAKPWFAASEVSWILAHCHLVIGRSGANTVSELMVKGIPAILIPISNHPGNEQWTQAQFLADQNASLTIRQDTLTTAKLLENLKHMENHYASFKQAATKIKSFHNETGLNRVYQSIQAVIT